MIWSITIGAHHFYFRILGRYYHSIISCILCVSLDRSPRRWIGKIKRYRMKESIHARSSYELKQAGITNPKAAINDGHENDNKDTISLLRI